MTNNMSAGVSDAARWLDKTFDSIVEHRRSSVTLSRHEAIERVFEAYRDADESWKLATGEAPVSEEVMETACRFLEALPLGVPSPTVTAEPDGHINLEWYTTPRRLVTVSIGPNSRLHWAVLIGSEDPRGSGQFVDRIPKTLLYFIERVHAR